jgi:DNA-binding IclR family transcriptional regulator
VSEPKPPEGPQKRPSRDRHRVEAGSLALDIFANLVIHPGLTVPEIWGRLRRSASADTVRDHLKTMVEDGHVNSNKRRYYPDPSSPLVGALGSRSRDSLVWALIGCLVRTPAGLTARELAASVGVSGEMLEDLVAPMLRTAWMFLDGKGRLHIDLNALVGAVPFDAAGVEYVLSRYTSRLLALQANLYLATFNEQDSTQVVARNDVPGVLDIEDLVDGTDISAHSSALGRGLLWTFSRTERLRYLKERGMPRLTPQTVRTIDDWETALAESSQTMIFSEHGETIDGIHCTAVLARNGLLLRDRFTLAVAIRGAPTADQESRALDILKACSADLTPFLMPPKALPSALD